MNRNTVLMAVGVAIVVAIIMYALQAHAQAVVESETFMQSLENPIMEIVAVVITALLSLVTFWINKVVGLQVEARHREALQSALENAARLVLQTALDKDTGGKTMKNATLEIGDAAMNVGIEYVRSSVPDAVKKFGLDKFLIDKLLRPKLTPKIDSIAQGGTGIVVQQPGK